MKIHKKVKLTFFLSLFILSLEGYSNDAKAQSTTGLVNGKIPDFTMQTFDGKTINSDELKGKIILLEFWDTHCGPCRKLMPDFEKIAEKYKNNDNVVIFSVNAGWETKENAKLFVDKYNYKLSFAYMDKKVSRRKMKVRELPYTIIIDKNFDYQYVHIGYNEKTEQNIMVEFDSQIQKALKK